MPAMSGSTKRRRGEAVWKYARRFDAATGIFDVYEVDDLNSDDDDHDFIEDVAAELFLDAFYRIPRRAVYDGCVVRASPDMFKDGGIEVGLAIMNPKKEFAVHVMTYWVPPKGASNDRVARAKKWRERANFGRGYRERQLTVEDALAAVRDATERAVER